MIKRLRGLPDMDAAYPTPHDHRLYGRGHAERVEATIGAAMAVRLPVAKMASGDLRFADLSCGNNAVLEALMPHFTTATFIDGDYAPGRTITGPIQDTLRYINPVDLFVCGETIEHLDDPVNMLNDLSRKTKWLVLSTPVGCHYDANPEHVWSWDMHDVTSMLESRGFPTRAYTEVDSTAYGEPYRYGIWTAESTR